MKTTILRATLLVLVVPSAFAQAPSVHETKLGDDGARLGWALSPAGDVDADGTIDYVGGEPRDDTVANSAGRARVWSGDTGNLLFSVLGDAQADQLGYSVSGVGDVTGDGRSEFVAGAPFDDDNGLASGLVRVYRGNNGTVLHQWLGDATGDEFGRSVADAGDVDNDGWPDVIVGAPQSLAGGDGYARIFSGDDGLVIRTLLGVDHQGSFGISVDGVGDIDKDGWDDVVVGAYQDDTPGTSRGRAYVYSGLDGSTLMTLDGLADFDWFGWSVAGAGDVNGDTWPDIVVGAYGADPGGDTSGQVRVFSGFDASVLLTLDGEAASENLGWSVDGAGDVNGDNRDDVIVGAPILGAGRARIFSGLDGALLMEIGGDNASDQRGRAVAGLGQDLNGDGHPEVLVGAPLDDDNGSSSGSLLVVSGFQPWTDVGGGLAGTTGEPNLAGVGTLLSGSFGTATLTGALPSTTAWLVLGFTNVSLPFKLGTLVPDPAFIFSGLPVDSGGTLALPFLWPVGIPSGFETFMQVWTSDAGGPVGFAASNGLRATAP
jgi:hypothetical protein